MKQKPPSHIPVVLLRIILNKSNYDTSIVLTSPLYTVIPEHPGKFSLIFHFNPPFFPFPLQVMLLYPGSHLAFLSYIHLTKFESYYPPFPWPRSALRANLCSSASLLPALWLLDSPPVCQYWQEQGWSLSPELCQPSSPIPGLAAVPGWFCWALTSPCTPG